MATLHFLPIDIRFQILKHLAESGESFLNTILASKLFHYVYDNYSLSLDSALIQNSIGQFLPFTWLLSRESMRDNEEDELDQKIEESWARRKSWLAMDEKDFVFSKLGTSHAEKRQLYRLHSTVKAISRQLSLLATHPKLQMESEEEKSEFWIPQLPPDAESVKTKIGVYIYLLKYSTPLDSTNEVYLWRMELCNRASVIFCHFILQQTELSTPVSAEDITPFERLEFYRIDFYECLRSELLDKTVFLKEFVAVRSLSILSRKFTKTVLEFEGEPGDYNSLEEFKDTSFVRGLTASIASDFEHLYRFTRVPDAEQLDDYQRKYIVDKAKEYKDECEWSTSLQTRTTYTRRYKAHWRTRALRSRGTRGRISRCSNRDITTTKYYLWNSDEDDFEKDSEADEEGENFYDEQSLCEGMLELPFHGEEKEEEFLTYRGRFEEDFNDWY